MTCSISARNTSRRVRLRLPRYSASPKVSWFMRSLSPIGLEVVGGKGWRLVQTFRKRTGYKARGDKAGEGLCSRLRPMRRLRRPRVIRPGVFGVAAFHFLFDFGVGAFPEAFE